MPAQWSLGIDLVFFNEKSPGLNSPQHIHKLACSGELATYSADDTHEVQIAVKRM